MKKYLLIICALASMMLSQNAFSQNADFYKKQDLPLLSISDALEVSLDSVRNNALCFKHKHNNMYYVYLDSILVISKLNGAYAYAKWEKCDTTAIGAFYKRADGEKADDSSLAMTNYICIGSNGDSQELACFNIRKDPKKQIFLNLRFKKHIEFDEKSPLLDTVGLRCNGSKMTWAVGDTIDRLRVAEPRFSVYQSLELNGEKIHECDSISDYNDPESLDCIEIDLKSHWHKLKVGTNKITVNVVSLDDNCKFAKVHSQAYTIEMAGGSEPKSFPWLWVGLGVILLVVLALALILILKDNKKKVLKKLVAYKTQICTLLDDKSVPCGVKDKLEGLSKRVTEAISDLRGKKSLKKVDKEECEKLLNEIDENVKELQSANPEPQPVPMPEPNPEPEPEQESEPQPVSNDDLIARIKELEEKLSKVEDEKQEELAEQKTKLDELHEKAVEDLQKQLEQKHAEELEELHKNHEQELKAQEDEYEEKMKTQEVLHQMQLSAQKEEYETMLRQAEEERRKQIKELEANCERAITELTKSLSEVKRKWEEDKKYVVDMYKAYDIALNQKVEGMKSNADDKVPVYNEMLQIHSESVHSFRSFHEQFQAIMEKELTISEMREELAKVFSVHIDYERSWINALCRLHAYAKVEKLAPMFGLYNEYKVDISELYMQFLALAGILGFEKIRVPELFVEEFHSQTAESDNTNLVLPIIYPNYVEALIPSMIYDLHTVGYAYNGRTRKPKVAYYV